jgi:hypothetical protein
VGIAARTAAFRLNEQDRRRLCEIQDAFHPFLRTASDVIRFSLELVHGLIFGSRTLTQLWASAQRLHCATSQCEPLRAAEGPLHPSHPAVLYMDAMYARIAEWQQKERVTA